jgi:hypothetical protein
MPVIILEDNTRINTFSPPPPGFDPLVASASELERHGFPARPDDPHLLKLYRRLFTRLKGRLKYVQPTFRISHDSSHGPRNQRSSGVFTGDNWSGGVRLAPPGQSFSAVLGHWLVPNAYAPTSDPFLNSYWVGLDGYTGAGANEALQAGVDCSLSGGSSSFYLWHQWVPSGKVEITNPAVNAGDLVGVSVSAEFGAGATTATIFFTNISSGAATSYAISAPPGTQLAGNSAEWIVEAPDGAGQLADYGQVFFDDCAAKVEFPFRRPGEIDETLNITQGSTVVSGAIWITSDIIQCAYGGVSETALLPPL